MQEVNISFELLSSMSPRVSLRRRRKSFKNLPTKLSLKRHFRKSTQFDKKSALNDSVIIIEDSSCENSPNNCKIIKAPVVVSSTSESGSESNDADFDPVLKVAEKYVDIENWLSENEKMNGYSEIYSFRNNSMSNSYEEKFGVKNMTQDVPEESLKSATWKVVSIETNYGKEQLRNLKSDDFDGNSSNSKDFDDENERDVLYNKYDVKDTRVDELYSALLRKKMSSSDRMQPEILFSVRGTKSEPKIRKSSSEKAQNLLREVQLKGTNLGIKSQTHRRMKSWDSSSENESIYSSVSCKSTDGLSDNCKKTSFSDESEEEQEEECETDISDLDMASKNILDDLYGTFWRENKCKILPKSEPRLNNHPTYDRIVKTERKPRKDIVRKQEDLSKVQLSTPSVSQSWAARLAHLCDSDSVSEASSSDKSSHSSNSYELKRKKLIFDENDDHDDQAKPKTLESPKKTKTVKNKEYLTSENGESLKTKLYKKYAEKDVTRNKDKNKENIGEALEQEVVKDSGKEQVTNEIWAKVGKRVQYSFLKSLSGIVPLSECCFEAKYYRENYKTAKNELAKKLFKLYNEKIFEKTIPENTPLEWNDRMRGTAGFCYNRKKIISDRSVERSCRIVLSTKVLDTADRLRDTLLHEMCHAVTWIVNQVSDGHGPYWKSWTNKALKVFPELPPVTRCHSYAVNTKYTYKCVDCGYSIGRHSKSLDIERKRCGYCYGKFQVFINKVNKNGEKQCTPARSKTKPNDFAMYVKNNYSNVKKANLTHAEVMKILGQQFSALKIAQNAN